MKNLLSVINSTIALSHIEDDTAKRQESLINYTLFPVFSHHRYKRNCVQKLFKIQGKKIYRKVLKYSFYMQKYVNFNMRFSIFSHFFCCNSFIKCAWFFRFLWSEFIIMCFFQFHHVVTIFSKYQNFYKYIGRAWSLITNMSFLKMDYNPTRAIYSEFCTAESFGFEEIFHLKNYICCEKITKTIS